MGIVRRILQEILNIPLDNIRLDLFEEFISLAQVTDEMLIGTLIVLAMTLVATVVGLARWVTGVVMRRRNPLPHLIVPVVVGFLSLDTLVDFLLAVIGELKA